VGEGDEAAQRLCSAAVVIIDRGFVEPDHGVGRAAVASTGGLLVDVVAARAAESAHVAPMRTGRRLLAPS
jgi:hypothetical protein